MTLFKRKRVQVDQVIDLRAPASARWGSPVPCPSCGGRGYLDHIDPFREIMFLHCTQCELKYEVARSAMAAEGTSDTVTS